MNYILYITIYTYAAGILIVFQLSLVSSSIQCRFKIQKILYMRIFESSKDAYKLYIKLYYNVLNNWNIKLLKHQFFIQKQKLSDYVKKCEKQMRKQQRAIHRESEVRKRQEKEKQRQQAAQRNEFFRMLQLSVAIALSVIIFYEVGEALMFYLRE